MPNRIIREGWIESEAIHALSAEAERFFLRLCLRADDFGRYHANHVLLRSNLFPLHDSIDVKRVHSWVEECARAGLLDVYECQGKRFLLIRKFDQRTRAAKSKFPEPPNDGHMSVKCQTGDGHPRTYSYSYSEASAEPGGTRAQKMTLPPSLDTQEFRDAWDRWLIHWGQAFGRGKPMPMQTEDVQLREIEPLGSARAIAAINNAIAKGDLRKPAEPFAGKPKTNGHEPALKYV